jgi:hypothetical protein
MAMVARTALWTELDFTPVEAVHEAGKQDSFEGGDKGRNADTPAA